MANQHTVPEYDATQQNDRSRFALQAAEVGTWDLDILHQQVWWDEYGKKVYGFKQDDIVPYNRVFSCVHPDDRNRVDEAVQWALNPQSEGYYDINFRTIGAQDGQLRWLHCRGRAFFDEQRQPYRFSGTAQDVTQLLQTRQQLLASEAQFADLVTTIPVATAVFVGHDMLIQQVNAPMLSIWGKNASVIGKTLHVAMPELEGQPFLAQLQHVFDTGEPFRRAESMAELIENGQRKTVWFNHEYKPLYNNQGQIYGVINTANDVTVQVLARRQVAMSEARFRSLVEQAPVAMAIFRGANHVIETANQAHLQLWGRQAEQVLGKPLFEALPETKGLGYEELLTNVLTTGDPFYAHELSAPLVRNGQLETVYFNFVYQPLREADGTITAVTVVANEITEQVVARQTLEENTARFRSLIQEAPVATMLLVGPEYTIELANEMMIQMLGKGPDILGQTATAAVPELAAQTYLQLLDNVYTTGTAYKAQATPGELWVNGEATLHYFDFTYKPLRNPSGAVYGILCMAVDVTAQVLARHHLEETATALQNAIELAELGTFSVDVITGALTVSPRVADWFGFDSLTANTEVFISSVGESERAYVRNSLTNTLLAGPTGRYDVVHSVIHAKTGQRRILHALGQVYFDATGQPIRIEGTAQDVTAEQELQRLLEQQVQERTEELSATNEELTATNEELATANEGYAEVNKALQEANELLSRSNDNLQTFAYIASHDLQEPLRKIQQFGDLLKTRFMDATSQEGVYLERMQVAASRMSNLIKDLLDYSRISTQRDQSVPVSLQTIVANVLTTLDWTIQETGAQIQVEALPTLPGNASQLSQLFQNLLSNALKFRRADVVPFIQVQAQLVAAADLPTGIKPSREAARYYRIEVSDNGVGFDEKYLDRIFQVFQRLYNKNEFAGTGIGLAISEKVVANHGGAITARSLPGQGSTFIVYLPQ